MSKHVGGRGRDAVLQEKKASQQYLVHQHKQRQPFWEKIVGYFAVRSRPEQSTHQTERFQKWNPIRGQNELQLIFARLKDCCDEGETDLKEAIKYGLKIIADRKHRREGSKIGSHTSSHDASNQENQTFMTRH